MQCLKATRSPHFNLKRRAILRWLGLPNATRFEQVTPTINRLACAARLAGDVEMETVVNVARAYLKVRLLRSCLVCGIAVGADSRWCMMCTPTRYGVRG